MTAAARMLVTLGPCDDMRAEVFVRAMDDVAAGARITGRVSGPRRGRDITLPTTSRLAPLAESLAGPAARAILTEPAFWTPELPNRYRLEARLELSDGGLRLHDSWIGLRRLGVRGRSFWLDGRRWVPRVVAGVADVSTAKQGEVGIAVESPDDDLLQQADEIGVAVVSLLDGTMLEASRIVAWAGHPAALLAVVRGGPPDELAERIAAVRGAKGTLLVGLEVDGGQPPPPAVVGPDFLVARLPVGGLPHDGWRAVPASPVIARRSDVMHAAAGPRAGCDALQRDLALWGVAGGGDATQWDWAGYLVG